MSGRKEFWSAGQWFTAAKQTSTAVRVRKLKNWFCSFGLVFPLILFLEMQSLHFKKGMTFWKILKRNWIYGIHCACFSSLRHESLLRQIKRGGKAFDWWQWCWWQRYVDNFMMVTDLRCWWQNHYVGDFFPYVGDFFNVSNQSPTSLTCHQTLPPTSVTKIDVIHIFYTTKIWNKMKRTQTSII